MSLKCHRPNPTGKTNFKVALHYRKKLTADSEKREKEKPIRQFLFLSERRSLVHWAVRLSLSFSFANRLKFHYQQEQSETAHRKHTATSVNNIFPEIRDSPLTNARAGKRFFIGTVGHRWLQATRGNLSLSFPRSCW